METPKAKEIMREYLANDRNFNTYLGARKARYKNAHHVLLEVCEQLKKRGCVCYVPKDDYEEEKTHLVYCFKGTMAVTFGFAEVYYRWYVGSEYGNCRGLIGEHGYDYPFEVEDILQAMEPATTFRIEWVKDEKCCVKL